MTSATTTREALAVRKTGLWYVVIQGIPFAFGMVENHPQHVPSAIWAILRMGSETGIFNYHAHIIACLKAGTFPDVGPATSELFSSKVTVGDMNIKLSDDRTGRLKSLFKHLCAPTTQLMEKIAAGIGTDITIDVSDSALFSTGDFFYIDDETFRVNSTTSGTPDTITATRGQCGSERGDHAYGCGIYKSPPYWKGRRVALVRTFEEIADTEYDIRWIGNVTNLTCDTGGNEWTLEAADELRMLDKEVTIPGRGKATQIIWIRDSQHYRVNVTHTETDAFDEIILDAHPYVQLGDGIIKVEFLSQNDAATWLKFVNPKGETSSSLPETGEFGTPFPFASFVPDAPSSTDYKGDDAGYLKAIKEWILAKSRVLNIEESCNQLIILTDEHLICGDADSDADGYPNAGTPPKGMLLKLLQSDEGDWAISDYDVLPFGCALPDAAIDFEWILRIQERFPDLIGTLILGWDGKEFNIRTVIQDYLLAPLFARIIPQCDGKFGIRYLRPVSKLIIGKYNFTKSNLIAEKGVKLEIDHSETISDYLIKYNRPVVGKDDALGNWIPVNIIKATDDVDTFYNYYKETFDFKLFCLDPANYGTAYDFAAMRIELVELRCKRPLPKLTIYTRLDKWDLEMGDVINVNFADIPIYDAVNGNTLVGELTFEVIRKEYELKEELIKLVLMPLHTLTDGCIAPALKVTAVDATEHILTVEEHYFSTGTYNEDEEGGGGKDVEHFAVGDRVRIYYPQPGADGWNYTGTYFYAGLAPYYIITNVNAATNQITIQSQDDEEPTSIIAGCIVEYAEYPAVNDAANPRKIQQEYRIFMAYDGVQSIIRPPSLDEFLPSTYDPAPAYTIKPYNIMAT